MDDQRVDRESSGVRFRKLRIAWSVLWGVVAVLLCVLWVRSYSRNDLISRIDAGLLTTIGSHRGYVYFSELPISWSAGINPAHPWRANSLAAGQFEQEYSWIFYWYAGKKPLPFKVTEIHAPHWYFVSPVVVLAAISWIPRRFSLRTLIVAMTVVAVALGVIVWARK
jgi:hypothetical protein